ncbi:MAG TPA: hybrid sensor histidine kinase/response regulator [Candidatus Omnitrophota bacterium]|nr:hybrid sensor histidine kinase/response regulator [Candidatus Omnitrophota bacterium]HPS36658.1 hybrid sensor histidine kinase/response regulator [Candidatus Omnitrophota bacterium]
MKKRILIVDDSALVRDMYKTQIEEAGYEVITAEDGVAAINNAFLNSPDLILLDVQMPKINGYQVCRLLKDHPLTKDIPIVIMTAREARGFVQDPRKWSFQTGANGYFGKDEGIDLIAGIKMFLKPTSSAGKRPDHLGARAMSETEIMLALSQLLDRQLYLDVTRLKELDEKKDAFVGNVSHELKSPLAIIKGFLENIRDGICGPTTESQRDAVTIMLRTVERLSRLIKDILDLSQIAAGKMKMSIAEVDLCGVLRSVHQSFALEASKKKIDFKVEVPAQPVLLSGDQDRLTQVVVNLVSNALKYTPEERKVIMRLSTRDHEVRVEVEDTGGGISDENKEKIFDKFERILTEKKEGTGLGLSIAKDIVDLHGGRIWLESKIGKGSKFIFILPSKIAI